MSDVETIEYVNTDPSQAHLITEGSQAVALWRKPEMRRLMARRRAPRRSLLNGAVLCPRGTPGFSAFPPPPPSPPHTHTCRPASAGYWFESQGRWPGSPEPGCLTTPSLPKQHHSNKRPPAALCRDLWGELMATYRCPERLARSAARGDQAMHRACQAALCHLNIVLDAELAASLADAAIRRAFAKQGRAVPRSLWAQQDTPGAASAAAAGVDMNVADAGGGLGVVEEAAATAGLRQQSVMAAAISPAAALLHTATGMQLMLVGVAVGASAWGLMSLLLVRQKHAALALPWSLLPWHS